MNIINRAFQTVSNSVQNLLDQEPRVKFTQLLKGAAAAISASAFYESQGTLDFIGLQGLALMLAGSASLIENPQQMIERINQAGACLQIVSHTL